MLHLGPERIGSSFESCGLNFPTESQQNNTFWTIDTLSNILIMFYQL